MGHDVMEETGTLNERAEGSVMLIAGIAALVAVVGPSLSNVVAGFMSPGGGAEAHHEAGHEVEATASTVDYVRTVEVEQAAAASAAWEASEAARTVLKNGGNAYDALIAASFVVSVVRPHSTGIGGGGFVVWRDSDGAMGCIDGREVAPQAAHRDVYLDSTGAMQRGQPSLLGPRAAGVPGLVAMLYDLYQRKGSKQPGVSEWRILVRYGIEYAQRVTRKPTPRILNRRPEGGGFVVREQLAAELRDKAPDLARYPASAKVFLPNRGQPPAAGEVLYQEDLAKTLRQIADDPRAFYTGEIAERIEEATEGWITYEDLAAYEVAHPEPVVGTYRGYTVISMPPPSSGGTHLVQMLNLLEGYDLASCSWLGVDHLHVLAESMRLAYADRAEYMAGDTGRDQVEWLTSKGRAEELRGRIDMQRALSSDEVGPEVQIEEGDHTTHLSIVDAAGNAVASTQTINTGLGSKFVVDGTGILLNNEMDDFSTEPGKPNFFGLVQSPENEVAPGRRPLSSMTPTIVLDPAGKLFAVLGSPGGSRIITSVLQVIVNMVDFGMTVDEAVAAPRVHHQWRPDALWVDAGVDPEVCHQLAERGHVVYFGQKKLGNVQAVQAHGGKLRATSDPRGTGEPAGY